ncbi:MAG: CoA-binding protein [Proteobacteria bacterium]|nr:CoA-binding protein [Pseudomonadota bacterium]
MKSFVEPSSFLLIGATDNPAKPQYYLIDNLLNAGFTGDIYMVNPRLREILGRKVYADVADLPGPAELAMIVIPGPAVPETVAACGRKGIRSVIIGSGGFSEIGPGGQVLLEETLAVARRFGIRIMGPNSIGVTNPRHRFTTAFIDARMPRPGPVSFVAQTGAIGGHLLHWLDSIAKTICLGNRSDVDADEALSFLADDPDTGVIGVHSEGFRRPAEFVRAVKKCTAAGKPVVFLKAGQSDQGAMIASSHTGAMMAGQQMLLVAARQAGAVLVDGFEDLFDTVKVVAADAGAGRSFGLALVSFSGAALVTGGDVCAGLGLPIASAQAKGTAVPGKALYDMGVWAGDMIFDEVCHSMVRNALSQPEVSHGLVYLFPTPKICNFDPIPTFSRLRDEFPDKTILPCIFGHRELAARWVDALEDEGFFCMTNMERALRALARHRDWRRRAERSS